MPAKSLETKPFADHRPAQAALASVYRPTQDANMEARTDHLEAAFVETASRLSDLQGGMAEMGKHVAGIDVSLTGIHQRQAASVDKQFAAVDKRFDVVDKQFAAVDKRFDVVDKRFAAVDKRFDVVDKRFDAMDKRFDAVDTRFKAVDERFKAVDDHFADLKLAIATLSQRMEDGFRSIHEKLKERPTRVELLRSVVVLLLAVLSVGWGVGAYLLRTHGEVRAAEVIDAARGR
jgi:chromosome segregation ATPase